MGYLIHFGDYFLILPSRTLELLKSKIGYL